MADRIKIAGIEVEVMTNEEIEAAGAVMVCVTADMWSPFSDNVAASCDQCGAAIIHRPYMPANVRKICMPCAGIPIGTPR